MKPLYFYWKYEIIKHGVERETIYIASFLPSLSKVWVSSNAPSIFRIVCSQVKILCCYPMEKRKKVFQNRNRKIRCIENDGRICPFPQGRIIIYHILHIHICTHIHVYINA